MTDAEIEDQAQLVASRMRARGEWVTDDLLVQGRAAAVMLGISEGTLRNWSYIGRGPTPIRLVEGGPRWYRLIEIIARRTTSWAA